MQLSEQLSLTIKRQGTYKGAINQMLEEQIVVYAFNPENEQARRSLQNYTVLHTTIHNGFYHQQ